MGAVVGAGVAPVPVEGAPGAGDFEVEAGAGGALVTVDGMLVVGELEGAVVPVDGVPGAGDRASGEVTEGA